MTKTIWLLTDNRIGSNHQLEGVANYLKNSDIIEKKIEYTKWAALPNIIRGKTLIGISDTSKNNLSAPWPDIVLSASRRAVPVARWIKKQSPQTKLVHFLHPGCCGVKDFSYIFVPEHDKNKLHAPNIKYTIGSPHFITKEKLSEAYTQWSETFKHLPHPVTAVIVGGAIKKKPFTTENASLLAKELKKIKKQDGGSLLITTSRRTGKPAEEVIISELKDIPQFNYLWGDKGKNPYLGFLACADNIVVTGDSVSMCCEATGTKKPVKIFTGKDWLTKKHCRFVQSLYDSGYAQDLMDKSELSTSPAFLNVALDIAKIIESL